MPDPPTIWGKMRRATWAPFFAFVTLLPLMDMQTADYQKILVQAIRYQSITDELTDANGLCIKLVFKRPQ